MTGVRLGTLDGAPCRPNVTDRRATAALDPPIGADIGRGLPAVVAAHNGTIGVGADGRVRCW